MAARLKEHYQKKVVGTLTKEFGYKNPMAVPKLEKISPVASNARHAGAYGRHKRTFCTALHKRRLTGIDQRHRDVTGALNEQLRNWADRSVLQGYDANRRRMYRQFDRQNFDA